jgi:hypothetical protein
LFIGAGAQPVTSTSAPPASAPPLTRARNDRRETRRGIGSVAMMMAPCAAA